MFLGCVNVSAPIIHVLTIYMKIYEDCICFLSNKHSGL